MATSNLPHDMVLALRARFFEAFASRPRPAADQIVPSTVHPGMHPEIVPMRELLATTPADELVAADVRTYIEDNLSMLTVEAFLYFLPAFMFLSLKSYDVLFTFAYQLVNAFTLPVREDIVGTYDNLAQIPPGTGLTPELLEYLSRQHLEMFDSGDLLSDFHARVDGLTNVEGAAILTFFDVMQEAHGEDFISNELETAVERYWARYRVS